MDDPFLQLEKSFLPMENFKVLGGYDYGIYLFKKVSRKTVIEPKELIRRELVFSGTAEGQPLAERAGKRCLSVDDKMEFSPSIKISSEEIISAGFIELAARVRFHPVEPLEKDAVLLVLTIEKDGKSISYNKTDLSEVTGVEDFREALLTLRIPSAQAAGSVIAVYVWNKGKKRLLLEKMEVSAKGF